MFAQNALIFHYHIYKNAGSTIDHILKGTFQSQWRAIEASQPWGTLHKNEIFEMCLRDPSTLALSSHTARIDFDDQGNFAFRPIVFLRNPIDRVGSVFRFERKRKFRDLGFSIVPAEDASFSEYIRWRFEKGNGCVISNFQTIYLSGLQKDMRDAEASREDSMRASEILRKLPCFGIVEEFSKSLDLISRSLNIKLDRQYVSQNVDLDRYITMEDRIQSIADDLGPDLFDEVLQRNAYDLSLYNEAVRLFHQRS